MDAALVESLLPRESPVRIRSVDIDADDVHVAVESTADAAPCPGCRGESRHVHGRYTRQLRDRPCLGHRLIITLSACKFVCRRDDCPRGVFCERLTGLAEPHARTTTDLADAHRSIGFGRANKRRIRAERFQQVKDLTAQGHSGREIARRLGIDVKAVLRYRRADHYPDWQPGRALPTGLDPFAAFITEWIDVGNRNSADLYRDLKARVLRQLRRGATVSESPDRQQRSARPTDPDGATAPTVRPVGTAVVVPADEPDTGEPLDSGPGLVIGIEFRSTSASNPGPPAGS